MNNAQHPIPDRILEIVNTSTLDGVAIAVLLDRSGKGNHLYGHADVARQPVAFPMNLHFGGLPVVRFDESRQTFLRGLASILAFHTHDFTIHARVAMWQVNQTGTIFNTGSGETSNANGCSLEFVGEVVRGFITSVTNGGTVHLTQTTVAGDCRVRDVLDIAWRRTGASSRMDVRRESRFDGDPTVDITLVATISGGIDPGPATIPPCIGGYSTNPDDPAVAGSFDLRRLTVVPRAITDAELARLRALSRAEERFRWLPYAANRPWILGVDVGTSAGGGADEVHPNASGQAKLGHNSSDATIALATEMGITDRQIIMTRTGDSRAAGYKAPTDGQTGRAVADADLVTAGLDVLQVGDQTDHGGQHTAVSGAVMRHEGNSPGLSRRTPGPHTFDNYTGPGKPLNDLDIIEIFEDINRNDVAIGNVLLFDQPYEKLLELRQIARDVATYGGKRLGVIVHGPTVNGLTVTGPVQRYEVGELRDDHVLVQHLRRDGTPAVLTNLHDHSYPGS